MMTLSTQQSRETAYKTLFGGKSEFYPDMAKIYVAPYGDDSNPGSALYPFKTITRAIEERQRLRVLMGSPDAPKYDDTEFVMIVVEPQRVNNYYEALVLNPDNCYKTIFMNATWLHSGYASERVRVNGDTTGLPALSITNMTEEEWADYVNPITTESNNNPYTLSDTEITYDDTNYSLDGRTLFSLNDHVNETAPYPRHHLVFCGFSFEGSDNVNSDNSLAAMIVAAPGDDDVGYIGQISFLGCAFTAYSGAQYNYSLIAKNAALIHFHNTPMYGTSVFDSCAFMTYSGRSSVFGGDNATIANGDLYIRADVGQAASQGNPVSSNYAVFTTFDCHQARWGKIVTDCANGCSAFANGADAYTSSTKQQKLSVVCDELHLNGVDSLGAANAKLNQLVCTGDITLNDTTSLYCRETDILGTLTVNSTGTAKLCNAELNDVTMSAAGTLTLQNAVVGGDCTGFAGATINSRNVAVVGTRTLNTATANDLNVDLGGGA